MKFIAVQKNTRQSPRKVRLVANQVKNLPLAQAVDQLSVIQRRSTLVLLKTLKQAIANAINNHGVAFDQLKLDTIMITEGPRYRRFQAVSRGRAHGIIKRTCHIRVELSTKTDVSPAAAKASKAKKAEVTPAKAEKEETKPAAKVEKKQSAPVASPRQMGRGVKETRGATKGVITRNKAGKK